MTALSRFRSLPAALSLLALLATPLWAQDLQPIPEDPRIDPQTGTLKVNWPLNTPFDHRHMKLEIDLGAMTEPRFTAVQTLTLAARGKPRSSIILDAGANLSITSIEIPEVLDDKGKLKVPAQPLHFLHEGRELEIKLPQPAQPDEPFTIRTTYACDFSKLQRDGLTWIKPNENAESPTDRSPCIYSQGQAEHNHKWFPCHDFPNERTTTELLVTVPREYKVCSNGRLVHADPLTGNRLRYHWLQDKPHVYYLVTMVVGKFSIINLARPDQPPDMSWPRDTGRFNLPITAYVPIGKEAAAARSLANTPEMVAYFGEIFDEPYPWDKYTQVLVRGFNGGMENTSATTMFATLATMNPENGDGIISHELAHQWFGDYVTCRGWEHLWLNEGWASYCEALWNERKAFLNSSSAEAADAAYMRTVQGFVRGQRGRNRGSFPGSVPMVSNRYSSPDAPFSKADDVYAKGACVLHMLRERLGPASFYRGVALYLDRHKLGLADTDDFRKALEEATGVSLERFFEQWCKRPGLPRLDAELTFDASVGTLTLAVKQTQQIDLENPAYELAIPVKVVYEDDTTETLDFFTDSIDATRQYNLRAKPKDVILDPRVTNLAAVSIKKPLAMWIQQLDHGPTIFAKLQAIEHLEPFDAVEATEALHRATNSSEASVAAAAKTQHQQRLVREGAQKLAITHPEMSADDPAAAIKELIEGPAHTNPIR